LPGLNGTQTFATVAEKISEKIICAVSPSQAKGAGRLCAALIKSAIEFKIVHSIKNKIIIK
jgi:hypothetical protein